jgi:hypothetical protein
MQSRESKITSKTNENNVGIRDIGHTEDLLQMKHEDLQEQKHFELQELELQRQAEREERH